MVWPTVGAPLLANGPKTVPTRVMTCATDGLRYRILVKALETPLRGSVSDCDPIERERNNDISCLTCWNILLKFKSFGTVSLPRHLHQYRLFFEVRVAMGSLHYLNQPG